MSRPDLSHLMDPDPNAVPDLPVPRGPVNEGPDLIPGEGMRVSSTGDDFLISRQPDEDAIQDGGGTVVFDPLTYMSFRARISGGSIVTAASYINHVYYDSQWYFEQFEIESETIAGGPLAATQYLYAKIPVKYFAGSTTPSPQVPRTLFVSDPQSIDTVSATFYQETQTGYVTINKDVTPASYYLLTETPNPANIITIPPGETNGVGVWHFLIATITAAGVQQVHLGIPTLPQPLTFSFVSLTVVTS